MKNKETLEEVAERLCGIPEKLSGDKYKWSAQDRLLYNFILEGAKWQQERSYSEEDLKEAFKQSRQALIFEKNMPPVYESFEVWFEQYKKKKDYE
jgi:Pyruvate/2-oxoacid:ferredoxin oxidoreductase gamma subunit